MNRLSRIDNPTEGVLKELLFGRKIVSVEKIKPAPAYNYAEGLLHLDNGMILAVGGNEGCGGCPSGYYELTDLNGVDNAITNVVVEEEFSDEYRETDGHYRVFVITEDMNQSLVASFEGSDGNGYYGSGWWLTVVSDSVEKV